MEKIISNTIDYYGVQAATDGAINVPALVGTRGWAALPKAVQNRFARPVCGTEVIIYRGVMHKVEATLVGKIVAVASKIIGAPIASITGKDVPCDVRLYHDEKRGGTVWERVYKVGKREVFARTTKKAGGDGTTLECFGGGFGMVLDVFEKDRALHFESKSFFVELFAVRVGLPKFLAPGNLVVVHRDLGAGQFNFLLTVTHKLFGQILHQDGVFNDPDDMEKE